MRYFLLFIMSILLLPSLWAQHNDDQLIFKAMQDELERSKELYLPEGGKPYFISFHFLRSGQYEIKGCLGSLISSAEYLSSSGAVHILVGDENRTNQMAFDAPYETTQMPLNPDYNEIRRRYWLLADKVYKDAVYRLANKNASEDKFLKREAELKDWSQVPPVTVTTGLGDKSKFDKRIWEENVRQISAVCKDFPELRESEVTFRRFEGEVYLKNTDGTTLKYPVASASCEITVNAVTDSGRIVRDVLVITKEHPSDFHLEDLLAQSRVFCRNLIAQCHAPAMTKAYAGPVLFEGSSVGNFLGRILSAVTCAHRQQNLTQVIGRRYMEDRVGTKIIDNRLTMKDYTSMKEYKGERVYGAYEVDAEGVKPEKETVLIENGILKKLLNDRVPKLNAPASTGSARIVLSKNAIQSTVWGGVKHLQSSQGESVKKLRVQLLKRVRKDGLKYAYIIRSNNNSFPYVYRVDVRTGKETLICGYGFPNMELEDVRNLLGISKEETIVTPGSGNAAPVSIITPAAILVDNFVLKKYSAKDTYELEHPMKRNNKH